MGSLDWPYEQLVDYKPELTKQGDFDAFWDANLEQSRGVPLNAYASYNHLPVEVEKSIEVYRYNGHEGGGNLHQQRKLAWLRQNMG